jgi:hypothetical protein
MNYPTTSFALAPSATQLVSASSIPQNDIHPLSQSFTLLLYADCTTDSCIAGGSVEPVVTKTVGEEMVGTTMLDYINEPPREDGNRKVAEIVFDSTTEGPGEHFWVDDARVDGIHIAVSCCGMKRGR